MNHLTRISNKQRLFIISSCIVGVVLLSVSISVLSFGRRTPEQKDNTPVVKSIESLQFINTEKDQLGLIVRLKNTSKKSITAYTVSVCDVPLFAEDFSIGKDTSIGPGKTLEIRMPIQTLSKNCSDTPVITVLAVVFDDKSTSGEFKWAKGILDSRRGEKIQLKRINRLLAQAADWPDADKPAGIQRLKSEITALPIDAGELQAVRGGLASAKDRIVSLISELEQWNSKGPGIQSKSNQDTSLNAELAGITNLREGFAKLISLNEKWISKY